MKREGGSDGGMEVGSGCAREDKCWKRVMHGVLFILRLPRENNTNANLESRCMQLACCVYPANIELLSLFVCLCVRRCWALALFGGNSETGFDQNSTYSIFSISITLTDEGFQNFYEVNPPLPVHPPCCHLRTNSFPRLWFSFGISAQLVPFTAGDIKELKIFCFLFDGLFCLILICITTWFHFKLRAMIWFWWSKITLTYRDSVPQYCSQFKGPLLVFLKNYISHIPN